MKRDPFFQKIIERLNGALDPDTFENCAVDLLREVFPGIAPVKGGSDQGMDGAIGDGNGAPYALITTTGKDCLGNLTRNLRSLQLAGDERRKAVFATSRALTPKRRQNLFRRAKALEFTLQNVFDQEAFAQRLYHRPDWCKELLNLTGNPPALSPIPLSTRTVFTDVVIGRESDLAWLRETKGDRLLVAQPGAGKTFLLRNLAVAGFGLFVVDDDMERIADAYREMQPGVLFLDDAHHRQELLQRLTHLRQNIGANFDIVCTAWPGARDKIAHDLELPQSNTRTLNLLKRDEIVEVVKSVGVSDPISLIREIVDQAEGRPGLAVSLAQLCLSGGREKVILGNALQFETRVFEQLVGPHALRIAAAFAVGGNAGLSMNGVSSALGLSVLDIQEYSEGLATGGVLLQVDGALLAVRPPRLQQILVRDVFFRGAFGLGEIDYTKLAQNVRDTGEAALVLVGAAVLGGTIADDLIRESLVRACPQHQASFYRRDSAVSALLGYAWKGKEECGWCLEKFPCLTDQLREPAMAFFPSKTIHGLLEGAINDHRSLNQHPDHPFRLLEDWIEGVHPSRIEAIERRRELARVALSWLLAGEDSRVGVQAFAIALSPRFEARSADPGQGRTFQISFGLLANRDLEAVGRIWDEGVAAVVQAEHWEAILPAVEKYAYPARLVQSTPASDTVDTMRRIAARMVEALAVHASDRPAVQQRLVELSRHTGAAVKVTIDPEFAVLFPIDDYEVAYHERVKQHLEAVHKLANVWMVSSCAEAMARLRHLEKEAGRLSRRHPRYTPQLCEDIAHGVSNPADWTRAAISSRLSADLVAPFLQRCACLNDRDFGDLVSSCLNDEQFVGAAVVVVLQMPLPPSELLRAVTAYLGGRESLVESLCFQNAVPLETVRTLLRHDMASVGWAAATGEWLSKPKQTVRSELSSDWERAVVKYVGHDHWLREILKSNPAIATQWVLARLETPDDLPVHVDDEFSAAVSVLEKDQRREIVFRLPPKYQFEKLARELIGSDNSLYADLLATDALSHFHLLPLEGLPNSADWLDKALLALEAGYSPTDIVRASFGVVRSWWGNESDMWSEWITAYEFLSSHAEPDIAALGLTGQDWALDRHNRAVAEERREDIFGDRF